MRSNAPARTGGGEPGDLEEALIDQRVAKHVFAANVRVLQTAEEMSHELTALGKRR